MSGLDHGYSRYVHKGCRCETCTASNRERSRAVRAAGRKARREAEALGMRYIAEGIKHGLSGYRNRSCRCRVCTAAASTRRAA